MFKVRIGSGYYLADDVEAVPANLAEVYPTRERAEAEAEHVRATWGVAASEVAVEEVK